MSSILDALEKAEEERVRAGTGDLRRVPRSDRGPRLAPRLIAVVIAGLLLLNLVLWWHLRDAGEAAEPAIAATAEADREAPVPPPSPLRREEPAPAAKPPLSLSEQLKRNAAPSTKPLFEEAQVAPKPAPPPAPASRIERPTESTRQAGAEALSAAALTETDQASTRPLPAPEVTAPPAAEAAASPAPLQPAAAAGPSAPQIPLVWELPQGLREKVLRLKSSVHVYNELAERRFVIIDMRRYAEGDSLPPDGFRLHRIDRDGVVIDYGDGLVRLPRP